jgi:hypothetical protein
MRTRAYPTDQYPTRYVRMRSPPFRQMATELRLCAPENFKQRLALETRTIQSIDSAKLDEIHEQHQQFL